MINCQKLQISGSHIKRFG
uniref:Uncharacterized protein n=1 Tax=Anguilla anguilla TaxID=7936 RepID=A0A0E9XSQ4_ANGAN